jgi:hypothetical protein
MRRGVRIGESPNCDADRFFGEALLEEQEKGQARKVMELKDAIQAGVASGPGVLAEEVFDRLETKYASMEKRTNG